MPGKDRERAVDTMASTALASDYSAPLKARLCGGVRRLTVAAAGLSLALALGGCSTSFQLGALFGKDEAKTESTASAAPQLVSAPDTEVPDLAMAKAAAAEVLARGTKDASLPWEDPRTGARGTVTPLASAYPQDGTVCQDFLASYVRGDKESWYQGDACRHGTTWQVRDMRALQRT